MGKKEPKQTMSSRFTTALVAAAAVQYGAAIRIEQYAHYDLSQLITDAVL